MNAKQQWKKQHRAARVLKRAAANLRPEDVRIICAAPRITCTPPTMGYAQPPRYTLAVL